MTTIAIVQARMGSSRFPGKSLETLHGDTLVSLVKYRLEKSTMLDGIVFAIPDNPVDDVLARHLESLGAGVFRGSTDDVQARYIAAAEEFGASVLVRITADCPLIDWNIVDNVINLFESGGYEYASNVAPPTFPDGMDVEVFKLSTLKRSRSEVRSEMGIEHVTWDLRESGGFQVVNFSGGEDLSNLRMTVDYPSDLMQLNEKLPPDFKDYDMAALLALGFDGITGESKKRNEGATMTKGQKLWSRAKDIIPGGSMLLSKRSEMFLPEQWPSYYSKAKGLSVWDLEGNEFRDFALMGVGTSSLGYGDAHVDKKVVDAIHAGVMSSLNSPAEVRLAEVLVELHPWSEMVRFARTGGEANAIAIRIARAATGRDKVAICGYHGWHDWYLSANLSSDSNLDGHLLAGLQPAGVPKSLLGSVIPFEFNDLAKIKTLIEAGDLAAVKMEVSRSAPPAPGFLEEIRRLCSLFGTVLIFDECTSGFREEFGGLHLKYGVYPDMAMFGKALGNGYAITAVVGSREVMEAAQNTFISSTFWTERLGPEAALATLARMKETESWIQNTATGLRVKKTWAEIFRSVGMDGSIFGLDSMPGFTLHHPQWNMVKTIITQSFLEKRVLATNSIYPSLAHTQVQMDDYFGMLHEILTQIAQKRTEEELRDSLKGPEAHIGFRRLN